MTEANFLHERVKILNYAMIDEIFIIRFNSKKNSFRSILKSNEILFFNNFFRVRVVSYNILADMYSNSSTAKDVLFPYCLPRVLEMDYRKHLIINELLGMTS